MKEARRKTQKVAVARREQHKAPHPLTIASRILVNATLALGVFAFIGLGGAEATWRAMTVEHAFASPALPRVQLQTAVPTNWNIDVDADGVADFANPTHGMIRTTDAFGSGGFGAVRDAGKRHHQGVDYVAAPGAPVHAPISGRISHLGFAYGGDKTYRYVEIANPNTGMVARVLYIDAAVVDGDEVVAGDVIGAAQDLGARYPGITNHVHVELRDATRTVVDASTQLPLAPVVQAGVAALPASDS
jgi:murein DD-endopeptidase MepM/ murein hydrolase activator NlpD